MHLSPVGICHTVSYRYVQLAVTILLFEMCIHSLSILLAGCRQCNYASIMVLSLKANQMQCPATENLLACITGAMLNIRICAIIRIFYPPYLSACM